MKKVKFVTRVVIQNIKRDDSRHQKGTSMEIVCDQLFGNTSLQVNLSREQADILLKNGLPDGLIKLTFDLRDKGNV